ALDQSTCPRTGRFLAFSHQPAPGLTRRPRRLVMAPTPLPRIPSPLSVALVAALLGSVTSPRQAAATWMLNGNAVCAAADGQYNPAIVSDGVGGAIVAWYDYRSGDADVYAQRVAGDGSIVWGGSPNGVAVCTVPGAQMPVVITTDGAGGAVIMWQDQRSGAVGIYAQ